jgi:NAD(P)-dependent dehydrogenase (short-subunit alcohol dehydrogenase family)
MSRLANKVAIVSGAAHGIGRAIAELFAEEGASVIVIDRDSEAGQAVVANICATGAVAEFVRADVSSSTEAERAIKQAAEQFGRIDVLVNNAAHLGDWVDVEQATDEQWERSFSTTFMGAVHFTRAALPWMTRQERGSIINVASIQGLVAGRSSAAYTSMKHALIGLTRSTALDFGARGIRANAICPGPIRTRISPEPGSELHQRQLSKTMLARTGEPREVAWAAVFLASDESSYITGAAIPVDGGWTAF